MRSTQNGAIAWILPSLDILASLFAIFGLLPIAGGLPSIASQGQPIIDGIWFTVNMGGAFLLLAGGIKLLIPRVQAHLFAVVYAVCIGISGTIYLELANFHLLDGGWFLMALCVGVLLFMLRRPWFWAITGAVWCVLLLGLWSIGGIISFFATETQLLSLFLPFQIIAFVSALILLALHLRYWKTWPDG
jgi:hypothetical protein